MRVGAATGAVVGLVAMTPAAGYVSPLAAIVIGALGACASYAAIQLRNRTRIDDALDVFACHGVAGIVGALLTGVFAQRTINAAGADGLLAGNPRLLGVQAIAVLCTIVFAGAMTAIVLRGLALVTALRSAVPNELRGIDLTEHGEHAYHDGDTAEIGGEGLRVGQPVLLTAEVEREPELMRADAA